MGPPCLFHLNHKKKAKPDLIAIAFETAFLHQDLLGHLTLRAGGRTCKFSCLPPARSRASQACLGCTLRGLHANPACKQGFSVKHCFPFHRDLRYLQFWPLRRQLTGPPIQALIAVRPPTSARILQISPPLDTPSVALCWFQVVQALINCRNRPHAQGLNEFGVERGKKAALKSDPGILSRGHSIVFSNQPINNATGPTA